MALLTLMDVINREAFRLGLPWLQKSAVYLMIWGGFLGAALTTARGAHLRPEVTDRLWPKKTRPLIHSVEEFLTGLFCAAMAVLSISYVMDSKSMGDSNVATGLPIWVIQLVIPYSFASMAIRHLAYAFLPKLRPKKPGPAH